MDSVKLNAANAATFVFTRQMGPWADVYDLAAGKFRAMMRQSIDSAIVLYEWSSDIGNITFDQTAADGSITFTTNPANGKTITIGTTTVTFVTPSTNHPVGNEVAIGVSLAATLQNLLTFLGASSDPVLILCSYELINTALAVTFKSAGTLGNATALATNVDGATASGATLSGGGGLLTMTADAADLMSAFLGDYAFDCRFEDGDLVVPMFGGTITFFQPVTR